MCVFCMLVSVYMCFSYFSFTFSAVCIVYSGVFLICLFSESREKAAWNWMSRVLRTISKMMRGGACGQNVLYRTIFSIKNATVNGKLLK